jgi:hypothetical protein
MNLPNGGLPFDVCYWPVTSLAVMQQFGRDRVESGHRADIVDRSKMNPQRTFSICRLDKELDCMKNYWK